MSFRTGLRWSPGLLLLMLLIAPFTATAATTSGSLLADETWSGTVTLTGDVTVPSGITLTIQPGTQVLFPALADDMNSGNSSTKSELLVQGSLIAVGTQTEPIRFQSNASVPGTSDWGGIWITWNIGQQTLQAEYCVVEHATKGITWQADAGIKSGALRHNTIRTLSGTALSIIVRNGAKLTIDVANNDISNIASGYGISCDAQGTNSEISGAIDGNTIANVNYHGIYFYAYNYASFGLNVSNNVIHADTYKYYGYAGINLAAYESYGVPSAITMENNTIYDFYYGFQSTGYRNRTKLSLLGNSISQCVYDGVQFSYNDYGSSYSPEMTISGNDIHDNGRWGVYIAPELSGAAARFTINNNLIHANVQEGLYLVSSPTNKWIEAHVTLNDIYGNQAAGVKASGPYRLLMLHNDIHDNTDDGVCLAAGTQARANYGSIADNLGSYDVRNESVFLVDAAGNFWGSATTQAMDAGGNPKNITRIYDQFDEPEFGRVEYSGWLGAAQTRPSLPVSHIATPLSGSTLKTLVLRISGTAVAPEEVSRVEVSTDNGASWVPAQGTVAWYFDWNGPADGTYTLLSRAVDDLNQFETPAAGVTVTIDGTLPRITSGQIAQSETWSGDISLTGDVVVPAGMTLTLSPGTTLRFAPGQDDQGSGGDPHLGELIVRGNLVAAGTEASPILMTSASASPARGDWQGIRVEANVSGQTVNLTYCTIEKAVYGVSVAAKTPGLTVAPAINVTNCIIRDSMTDGVAATSEAAARLSVGVGNSQITNAGRYGINGYSKGSNTELNLTVTGSTLTQHHVAGIRVYGYQTYTGATRLTVADSAISGCGNGIDFGNNNSAMSITSRGNTISQCANGIYSSPPNTSNYAFTVAIKDTEIHTNSVNGFSFSKSSAPGATVEVINSRIHDNGSDGVFLSLPENATSPDPVFSLNAIYANDRGIYVQAPGADIVYNDIRDSSTDGLVVATAKGATINRNNLSGSGGANFELKNDRLSTVDARGNYWGTLATQEMDDGGNPKNIGRIWDRFDDAAKGGVDYSGWLPSAMLLPTDPVSRITSPADGTALKAALLRLQGIATASAGVNRVDVSTDGGSTWYAAQGTYAWTYDWTAPANGTYTVLSRVEDSLGSRETVGAGIQVTIDDSLPTTTGTLTASETWSGTVGITGDITVPAGVTLTLSPGTVVQFPALRDDQAGGSSAGRAELLVMGSLVALGTTESPITFTSDSTNPGRGDWEGIRVDATTGPASLSIEHGVVEYAATGISATAGAFAMTIALSDVAVQHHAGDGVSVTANSGSDVSLTIDGSTITDCSGRGVYAYATYVATPLRFTVTNSTISANGGNGIYLNAPTQGKSTVDITGNVISTNTTYGIYAYYYNHYTDTPRSSFTARNNQVFSNGDYGISVFSYYGNIDEIVTGNTVYSHVNGIYLYGYGYNSHASSSIIRGNEIYNHTSWGLYDNKNIGYLTNEITANKIHHNATGVYLALYPSGTPASPDVLLTLNDVYQNTSFGVRYHSNIPARFLLNSLHENGGNYGGLYLTNGNGHRLVFNNLFGNTGAYDLRYQYSFNVDARRNYWGETALAQMESGGNPKNISRIYDYYDNAGYGRVDYSDWLAAPEILPTAPHSRITWPAANSVHKDGILHLQGVAVAPAGVALVEVSADGGLNWSSAQGTDFWSYDWPAPGDGTYAFLTRVTDVADLVETPGSGVTISIDHTLPTTSGTMAADETWFGDVTLTGDVTIPPGVSLTIDPGTTVRFASQRDDQESGTSSTRAELIVQGTLAAAGSAASPIQFTSSSPTPAAGDWYGIRLAPTTGPASLTLSHCTVEYATIGVSGTAAATAAAMSIDACTILSTSGDGVYASAPSGTSLTLSVQDSTITSVGGNGIHCAAVAGGLAANLSGNTISQAGIGIYGHGYGYSATDRPFSMAIQRNQVHHNRSAGIECKAEGAAGLTAEVTDNAVYSNAANGVKCWANNSSSYVLNAAVTLNDVYSNTGYGIHIQSGAGSTRNIFFNSIHENTGAGLQLSSNSATTANFNNLDGDAGLYALQNQTLSLINARSNYWGPDVTAQMDAGGNPKNIGKIYDSYDSASLGRVDYSEWLAAAVVLPGAPLSRITAPKSGAFKTRQIRIEGVGVSAYGVAGVEVSTDAGVSWVPAEGAEKWYYDWTVPDDGTYTIISRVIDDANSIEIPGSGVTVTIDGSLPTTSGILADNETWSGTVTVSGDITVPAGKTLVIEPGTVIRFAALGDDQAGGTKTTLAELIVNGSLVAQGTAANPIVLTSTSTVPEKGDWQGIRFLPATTGSSLTLAYVTIENAGTGVAIEANGDTVAISMTHCTVRHMTEDGVYLYALGAAKVSLEISDSEVYDLLKKGLHFYTNGSTTEVNGTIEGNLVSNTVETGIYVHSYGTQGARVRFVLRGNTVQDCGNGIYAHAEYGDLTFTAIGNTVSGCSEGISCYVYYGYPNNTSSVQLTDNEIHGNSGAGIRCESQVYYYASPFILELTGNRVYQNGGDGIIARKLSTGTDTLAGVLAFNTVHDNWGAGLRLNATSPLRVVFNNIHDNDDAALVNESSATVDARHNWWGAVATAEMGVSGDLTNIANITDYFDSSDLGVVNYAEWSTSELSGLSGPLSRNFTPGHAVTRGEGIVFVEGVAQAPAGIAKVEVSIDNGLTWSDAIADARFMGKSLWSLSYPEVYAGNYTLLSRVVAADDGQEIPGPGTDLLVQAGHPTTLGTLAANETWSGAIELEGDVTVPVGVTLTILPGTTVSAPALVDALFGGLDPSRTEIVVQGNIFAEGTTASPILLTSNGGQRGDWYGLRAFGSARLKDITVENGQTGVSFTADAAADELIVQNATVRNNALDGFAVDGAGTAATTVSIADSTVSGNGSTGILVNTQGAVPLAPSFTGNTVANNGQAGISYTCTPTSGVQAVPLTIAGNTIRDNVSRGIFVSENNPVSAQITIENNTIARSGVNLEVASTTAQASALNVSGNSIADGIQGIKIAVSSGFNTPGAMLLGNNTVQNNALEGIWCSATSSAAALRIEGSTVSDNAARGVYLLVNGPVTLAGNNLYDNGGHDLYNDSAATVDARGNWWGITTTTQMNSAAYPANIAAIYDNLDNPAKGAVDYFGWLNTLEIPPDPTLDPVSSPTSDFTQAISGTKGADTAILVNGVERVAATPETTWSYTLSLTEGNNAVAVLARTAAGMTSGTVSATIVRDTLPPSVYASDPVNGSSVRRPVDAIDITLIEASTTLDTAATLAGAEVLDGSGAVAGVWTAAYNHVIFTPTAPLGAGTYTATIRPTDTPLGNNATASVSFTVDFAPPATPVLDAVPAVTKVTPQTIGGTKETETAIWMDNVQIVPLDATTSWSYPLALVEGTNAHAIFARDNAGNKSGEVLFAIVLDRAAPTLAGTVPATGSSVNTRPAEVVFTFADQSSSIDAALTLPTAVIRNGASQIVAGSWTLPATNTVTFTPAAAFAESTYTASLTAYDLAGNTLAASMSFTYDATAPTVPTVNAVTSPTNLAWQMLSGTKAANSGIWINGAAAVAVGAATTWSYNQHLTAGDNTLNITSRDAAGNESGAATATIVFDDIAPLPVSTLTANGDGIGTTVALNWTGYNEQGQGDLDYYQIYVQDHLFTQVSGLTPTANVDSGNFQYTVTGLARGATWWFAVVGVDIHGNSLPSVTPVSAVTQDKVAPENATNLRAQSLDQQLVFAWDPSADTQGDLDGYKVYFGADPAVTLPKTQLSYDRSGLADGTSYTCRIASVDADGNESGGVSRAAATPYANPENVVVQPWSGYATVTWSPVSPTQYVKHYAVYASTTPFTSVDLMSPRTTTTSATANVAGLTNDTLYYFAVTAVNTSDGERKTVTTVTGTPVPDSAGPAITNVKFEGTTLAGGQTITRPGTVTLSAMDGSGVSRVEFAVDGALQSTDRTPEYSFLWNVAALSDGAHTLSIIAYDSLGHITQLDFPLTVALATPMAPVITGPANGTIVNNAVVTISGTAEPFTEVGVYLGGSPTGSTVSVGAGGSFSLPLTLLSGGNLLQTAASNRAGTSTLSATVNVTVDLTLPDPPTYVTASVLPGGIISLSWSASGDVALKGYHIYRSANPFTDIFEAVRVTSTPLAATSRQDLTPFDGNWYYRVMAVDTAGNESDLSTQVHALSDSIAPRAASIVYTPHGSYDLASGRMGPGNVDILLTVSEPLLADPFLSITPDGGQPIALVMAKQSDTTYTGSFTIFSSTPTGTAYAVFSARDLVANRGTEIDAGASFSIDTAGPAVSQISLQPPAPIENSSTAPVTIIATFLLSEPVDPATPPSFAYLLSGPGRVRTTIENPTRLSPQGQSEPWEATITLPADAGETAPENLSFSFQGADDLGNVSTSVSAANSFQVYQSTLPPLGVPTDFAVQVLPGGRAALTWHAVSGAADYQVYRRGPAEPELTALARSGAQTSFTDTPSSGGLYSYAVASVRQANSREALSAMSAPVDATVDGTIPSAPSNLLLSLQGTGVLATWAAPLDTDPLRYRLYRSSAPITDTTGLTPVRTGINDTSVTDGSPSLADHWYAVTAVDPAGNESLPSASAYQNAQLFPVASLSLVHAAGGRPILSWTHPATDLSGFNVYRVDPQGVAPNLKLNAAPVVPTSYTDTGFTGGYQIYAVTAVDAVGQESPARQVVLPALTAARTDSREIQRGLFNRLDYRIDNSSSVSVSNVRLEVSLNQVAVSSEMFSLAAGGSRDVSLLLGGDPTVPDAAELAVAVKVSPASGESVSITSTQAVNIGNGVLGIDLLNDGFTRGGTGAVRFVLTNTGAEEIEVVTAKASGVAPSNEVVFSLLDPDGNVLSSKPLQQTAGTGVVLLPGGDVVARIPAGASFTSDPVTLGAPLSSPDSVRLRLSIAKVYYHRGQADQASIAGLVSERPITLMDTDYFGEVLAVNPTVSYGSSPIAINGRAVKRVNGQPNPAVPLDLVISVGGFYRTTRVTTDAAGSFSYTFEPNPGESGLYTVAAVHPDLKDRPVQAQFTINSISVTPADVNLTIPRNYEKEISVRATAGSATTATNLRLVYRAADQPGGALPPGVHVTPGPSVARLDPGRNTQMTFKVWGDNEAPNTGRVIVALISDELPAGEWAEIRLDATFSGALPSLVATPSLLETGLGLNQPVTETVALENVGTVALTDVTLSLKDNAGAAAPSWVKLAVASTQGSIAPGEKRNVGISFTPTAPSITEGIYAFVLHVESSNDLPLDVPLSVVVTQSGIGNVLLKVSDNYTGTFNQAGQFIQGLAGARITLRHSAVGTIQHSMTSDAYGEALFVNLPAGDYTCSITAPNHEDYTGTVAVRPGVTATKTAFLVSIFVTVSWDVVETTIPDVYNVVTNLQYQTNVPAAVVVAEPSYFLLPKMNVGDVFTGQYRLTNYGLIRADNLVVGIPKGNAAYQWEIMTGLPSSLNAGQSITVAFRITKIAPTSGGATGGQAGGDCQYVTPCHWDTYEYECPNGETVTGLTIVCAGEPTEQCIGDDGGDDGFWNIFVGNDPCMSSPNPPCSDPCGCSPGGSYVDNLRGQYNDDPTNMKVKVPGGFVEARRYYEDFKWEWEHDRSNLKVHQDGNTIESARSLYRKSSSDPTVFVNDTRRIRPLSPDPGYRWEEKDGSWKKFTIQQVNDNNLWLMTSYGDRNGTLGNLVYAQEVGSYWANTPARTLVSGTLDLGGKHVVGVTDRRNRLVLTYEYDENKRKAAVVDLAGRRVDYLYTNGRLSEVASLIDDTTTGHAFYAYDASGRLNEKTDAEGQKTFIRYYPSGNVKSILDQNNVGSSYSFEKYADGEDGTSTTITTSSGKAERRRFNKDGEVVNVRINGSDRSTITRTQYADKTRETSDDEKGNRTTTWYDRYLNPTHVIFPDGSSVMHTYEQPDQDGRSFNRITRTEYLDVAGTTRRIDENIYDTSDESKDLLETREGCDSYGLNCLRVTAYSDYTDFGLAQTVTVKGNASTPDAVTRYTYYSDTGNVASTSDPAAVADPAPLMISYEGYDSMGNARARRDIRGNVWSYDYDHLGRTVSEIAPVPAGAPENWNLTTTHEYDAVGNKTATVVGVEGRALTFEKEYDTHYNVNKVFEPFEGAVRPAGLKYTERRHNGDKLPYEIIDQEGNLEVVQYSNDGRRETSTDAKGNVIKHRYFDDPDAPIGSKASYTSTWRVEYPTYAVEYDYDEMQRVVSQTVVLATGILARNADPTILQKVTIQYGYAPSGGTVVTQFDQEGRATLRENDRLNRTIRITNHDSAGGLVSSQDFEYDARGNLVMVRDPSGGEIRYEYDLKNRVTAEYRPMDTVPVRSYSYDDLDNSVIAADASGKQIIRKYDALGRLVLEVHKVSPSIEVKRVDYVYNELGSLVHYTMTDVQSGETVTSSMTYDNRQRKLGETLDYGSIPTKSYAYTYYANGKKASFTGPDGLEQRYDNASRLEGIDLYRNGVLQRSIGYPTFLWYRPTTVNLPGGVTRENSYDALMRFSSISAQHSSSGILVADGYSKYWPAGNLREKSTPGASYAYSYDETYRLTGVTSTNSSEDELFNYDQNGNRISQSDVEGNWTFNANNEIEAGNNGHTLIAHDATGNMTQKTEYGIVTKYIYDAENRLVRAEREDGTPIADYGYDPFGRRLWKKVNGTRTFFMYSDEGLIAELNSSGAVVKTYGYEPGSSWSSGPLFQQDGENTYWYLNDHLGTPQKMVDSDGIVRWEASYDAFGWSTEIIGAGLNNLRLPGQYYDQETGLHYNWHRTYEPKLGRYLQTDPILPRPEELNAYVYARNNPLNLKDPDGRSVENCKVACYVGCPIVGRIIDIALCKVACHALPPPWNFVCHAACEVVGDLAWTAACHFGCDKYCEDDPPPPPPPPEPPEPPEPPPPC